ncbi:MAG: ribonucleoside reductase, partial [Spiribacter salinus]
NQMNNLQYCETISATNPCVTADTWVTTKAGARQVRDLIGRPFQAMVDGAAWNSGPEGFFATGTKPVLRLTTACGRALRLTANHKVRKVTARTRWRLETEWVPAGDLASGDEVMLHDHGAAAVIRAPEDAVGYLLGLLIGDGVIRDDKTILSFWKDAACVGGEDAADSVMERAETLLREMEHRADFAGWQEVSGRNEYRISTAALARLAEKYGLVRGHKTLTQEIEAAPAGFGAEVLRGLFDADGSVQGQQSKGVSVRLAQSDADLLARAQRMLARLGINSTIYHARRSAGMRPMPDGKGGQKDYAIRTQHELVISGANLTVFAARVGFADMAKQRRLEASLSGYKRALNRERFHACIERIDADGEATVYDVQIPGVNAFDANGFYVHNCGEQPLPPYGACLLGSVN